MFDTMNYVSVATSQGRSCLCGGSRVLSGTRWIFSQNMPVGDLAMLLVWYHIEGVFWPHIKCFWDWLQIHSGTAKDKVVAEEEMNDG